jgi:hypothetical protein
VGGAELDGIGLIAAALIAQKEQAKATAIDQSLRLRLRSSLRQSGGRFSMVFRRGAEAPLYLRSKCKCNNRSRFRRDDKQENKQRQIQGSFTAFRMTTVVRSDGDGD